MSSQCPNFQNSLQMCVCVCYSDNKWFHIFTSDIIVCTLLAVIYCLCTTHFLSLFTFNLLFLFRLWTILVFSLILFNVSVGFFLKHDLFFWHAEGLLSFFLLKFLQDCNVCLFDRLSTKCLTNVCSIGGDHCNRKHYLAPCHCCLCSDILHSKTFD